MTDLALAVAEMQALRQAKASQDWAAQTGPMLSALVRALPHPNQNRMHRQWEVMDSSVALTSPRVAGPPDLESAKAQATKWVWHSKTPPEEP